MKIFKKPIQIYIEQKQDSILENLADKRGVSKASIIRECLEEYLKKLPVEEDPAMNIIGLGSSGRKDLSEKHDKYILKYLRKK